MYPATLRVTYIQQRASRFVKHTEALEFARNIQKKAEEEEEEVEALKKKKMRMKNELLLPNLRL